MNRRRLALAIIAGVLVVAGGGVFLHQKNQTSSSQPPTATAQDVDAVRPPEAVPAQIEQAPQRSQDVYMPPGTPAVGSSPARPTP